MPKGNESSIVGVSQKIPAPAEPLSEPSVNTLVLLRLGKVPSVHCDLFGINKLNLVSESLA